MMFTKVSTGRYATMDGKYAVQHDPAGERGRKWESVHDANGWLRTDTDAGVAVDRYASKSDAIAACEQHARTRVQQQRAVDRRTSTQRVKVNDTMYYLTPDGEVYAPDADGRECQLLIGRVLHESPGGTKPKAWFSVTPSGQRQQSKTRKNAIQRLIGHASLSTEARDRALAKVAAELEANDAIKNMLDGEPTIEVTIIGPNLNDQSKGQMHVHAAGCSDIKRDKNYRGHTPWTVSARDLLDVAQDVYPPSDFDWDPTDDDDASTYTSEFHVAPCVKFPQPSLTNNTNNHQESSAMSSNSSTTQNTIGNTKVVKAGDEWIVESADGEVVGEPYARKSEATAARKALGNGQQQIETTNNNGSTKENNMSKDATKTNGSLSDPAPANALTDKQRAVYDLLIAGKTVAEAATELGLSTPGVYAHKRAIAKAGLALPNTRSTRSSSSTRSSGTSSTRSAQPRSAGARGRSGARSAAPAKPLVALDAAGIEAALDATVTAQLDAIAARMDVVRQEQDAVRAQADERLAELATEADQLESLLKKMESVREAAKA